MVLADVFSTPRLPDSQMQAGCLMWLRSSLAVLSTLMPPFLYFQNAIYDDLCLVSINLDTIHRGWCEPMWILLEYGFDSCKLLWQSLQGIVSSVTFFCWWNSASKLIQFVKCLNVHLVCKNHFLWTLPCLLSDSWIRNDIDQGYEDHMKI